MTLRFVCTVLIVLFALPQPPLIKACPCVSSCAGKPNRDYHSCSCGCNTYASCWNGVLTDCRSCSWPTEFDSNTGRCETTSSTCPCPAPTPQPTPQPTPRPTTKQPTPRPTLRPTSPPTLRPSLNPSADPSTDPSANPTAPPSKRPSKPPNIIIIEEVESTITITLIECAEDGSACAIDEDTIIDILSAQLDPSTQIIGTEITGNTATVTIAAHASAAIDRDTIASSFEAVYGEAEVTVEDKEEFANTQENEQFGDGSDGSAKSPLSAMTIYIIVILSVTGSILIVWFSYGSWMYYNTVKKAEKDSTNMDAGMAESGAGAPGEVNKEPGSDCEPIDGSDEARPNLPRDTADDSDDIDEELYSDGDPGPGTKGETTAGEEQTTQGDMQGDIETKVKKKKKEEKRVSVFKRKELLQLKRVELAKMCRQQKLPTNGNKADLVNRLIEAGKAKKSSGKIEECHDV